jgi:hypothetical protein
MGQYSNYFQIAKFFYILHVGLLQAILMVVVPACLGCHEMFLEIIKIIDFIMI